MADLEHKRALVGVFVARNYSREKIDWLFEARAGFDEHSNSAWYLLIPSNRGYGVAAWTEAKGYDARLASTIINRLDIKYEALPCIVFRVNEGEHYYLKLGGKTRDQFCEEIGRITDLAQKCQKEGPEDAEQFREYVNERLIIHLRTRKILSATRTALPAISKIVGGIVGINELI
ncbi:hypothetical protein [Methylorubrum extorquens]|uniref:hypothetical protein n=1 Tax=Methylorubrum extorquens TaxID=408 RepID=UPI0011BEB5B4|nr:hypothetical protein [Methylorubrum extorquens]